MKSKLSLIILIFFSVLFSNIAEAQKQKPDKEFEKFWKDFQKAVKEDNKMQLSEFINFETFGGTKVEFINSYEENEPFDGITKKQILKTKISEFNIESDTTEKYLIEYQYGKSFAGKTFVFQKKDGKYMLWETSFQTYD